MTAPTSLIEKLLHSNIPVYPSVTGLERPISHQSLLSFLGALAWAWILLVSFTGLGRSGAKLFRVRRLPLSVGCSIGIAVAVFIGGLLNLLHAICAPVILGLASFGFVAYCLLRDKKPEDHPWRQLWNQASPAARLLLIVSLLLIIYRVSGTVRLARFDVSDDSAAYLAIPQKMLAVHHFSADPFSERRITSALGGSYFLQDEILSASSLSNIGMADRTLGFILLAGAVVDIGIASGLSTLSISVLEFLVFLVPQETFNLTFVVLPTPLLLAMVWLVYRAVEDSSPNWRQYAFFAGMVGGAVISLKSTYLPVVVALGCIPYIVILSRRRPRILWSAIACTALGVTVVLLLWMVAMKATSGTYLFPILGRGFDYSSYHLFQSVSRFPTQRSLIKIFLQGAALLSLAGILLILKSRSIQCMIGLSVLISSAFAIIAMNYASSADSIWRYNFPQFFLAIIIFYTATSAASLEQPNSRRLRAGFWCGLAAVFSMVFYYDIAGVRPRPFHQLFATFANYHPILASLSGRQLVSAPLRREYGDAEMSAPSAGSILENVAYSFLFDYKSRNIVIQDWPGAAGPPPGWPFGASSLAVRNYLAQNSIRYVIFGYRYALQTEAENCQGLEGPYQMSVWVRQQLWMNILTDLQLNQLKNHYRKIYDDGSIAVIDLSHPVKSAPLGTSAWTIDAKVDSVCTEIAARYFASQTVAPDVSAFPESKNLPVVQGS